MLYISFCDTFDLLSRCLKTILIQGFYFYGKTGLQSGKSEFLWGFSFFEVWFVDFMA